MSALNHIEIEKLELKSKTLFIVTTELVPLNIAPLPNLPVLDAVSLALSSNLYKAVD